jgi:ribonuclease BN (tRNA processing enzyme)
LAPNFDGYYPTVVTIRVLKKSSLLRLPHPLPFNKNNPFSGGEYPMEKLIRHTLFALLILVASPTLVLADGKHDILAVDKVKGPLSVMVLGSGGPIATASGRASAGYLIFTDGTPRVLMDVGGGTYQRVAQSGVNLKDLDIILLSHLHIDHTGDLSAVIKTVYFHNNLAGTARKDPVHIYGPIENGTPFPDTAIPQYPSTSTYVDDHYALPGGTERYLNIFAKAISNQRSEFHYQSHDLRSMVEAATIEEVLNTDDGLLIESIAVDHGPVPALAFRITYKGHSIVYSGDTGSTGPNMVTIARNADLLIYDTAIMDDLPPIKVFHDLHTEPTRLGEVAFEANVKKLVLSHITPVTEPRLKEIKHIIRKQGYHGNIRVAQDLKVFNLRDND